jgi:hypothetical protein
VRLSKDQTSCVGTFQQEVAILADSDYILVEALMWEVDTLNLDDLADQGAVLDSLSQQSVENLDHSLVITRRIMLLSVFPLLSMEVKRTSVIHREIVSPLLRKKKAVGD